jgi:hypothetical protein
VVFPDLHQVLGRRLRKALGPQGSAVIAQRPGWAMGLPPGDEPGSADRRLQELRLRPIRPDSALALALDSFLPWVACQETLRLGGMSRFLELNFDARCPTGVRGTPPHIELIASGPDGVVGVTVRVFDYLRHRQSRLSPAYAGLDVPAALAPWAALMRAVVEKRERFRYVDVPALAKLAVGLGRIFALRPVRLLYLFLEPAQAAGSAGSLPFAEHRAELARVAEWTRASGVPLVAGSFHELWEDWRAGGDAPPRLCGIVAELSRRYAVAMPR